MLDSNAIDAIIAVDGQARRMCRAQDLGQCEWLVTTIQIDELLDTPDEERRRLLVVGLYVIRPRLVPTESFVPGLSRLGYARLPATKR